MQNILKAWDVRRVAQRGVSLTVLALLFGLSWNPNAHALSIRISDGTTTQQFSDGDLQDWSPLTGGIVFGGTVGDFILNVTTGVSKPLIESGMDLNSINVSSGSSGGTLTIMLTDIGFTAAAGAMRFLSTIGGGTAGQVTYETYIGTDNTPFATTNLLTSGYYHTDPFSGSAGATTLVNGDPFSLTMVATITHTRGFQATSFNATAKLPAPSSLLLFGSGLGALGLLGRKKFKVTTVK